MRGYQLTILFKIQKGIGGLWYQVGKISMKGQTVFFITLPESESLQAPGSDNR